MTSENERSNSIPMTRHYPDLGCVSDWISNAARPIRSTTQVWVVTRHQYRISVLVSQTGKPVVASRNVSYRFSRLSLIRELKQRRRRRLRKRHLKSEFALHQTLSRLFHLVQFVKRWHFFWSWILKDYQSSGKERQSCCLLFTSSTKREIRYFHVVVVHWRQRNVQKSVMHVQSCCFVYLSKPIAFMRFLLTSPSSLLKLPFLKEKRRG